MFQTILAANDQKNFYDLKVRKQGHVYEVMTDQEYNIGFTFEEIEALYQFAQSNERRKYK